jgi:hypothetical protein
MIGAAGCGAVLNETIQHLDPAAARVLDRLLDPVSRVALPPGEIVHLTEILTAGLHNAWFLTGVFSLATLLFAWLMPARLSPRTQTAALAAVE